MQVLVVVAHPCDDSFNHAIADRACAGLAEGGHHVDRLDLYAESIDPVMQLDEWQRYLDDLDGRRGADTIAGNADLEGWVVEHGRLIAAAEAIVFVYPTWWSSLPAILKGWIERTLRPGIAFSITAKGRVRPTLGTLRHLVGISTYGSGRWYVKAVNDNGRRIITRAVRACSAGRARSTWLPFYSVDTSTPQRRTAFLDRVHTAMRGL
ncbi:MAG: NAD(P)H-dependent oxidoreductase [Ilumatobacteraceae bacterium]